MIVRNESAILERCLLSVLPHIHCYVICDTGSTDGTPELISRVLSDIPGEVRSTEFHNFGQARNEALEAARESNLEFEYLLLIDADMELIAESPDWVETLSHQAYTLRQVAGTLSYHNVRILDRQADAQYLGLTHEYLSVQGTTSQLESPFMLDHACGSSRTEKTERDLALLKEAINQDPNDARAHFYLAQTLREAKQSREAIEVYRRRISLGGWEEEVWYSLFMIARCHQDLGEEPQFLSTCLEAYEKRPSRAEPLHALAEHYRKKGQNETAALFAETGLQIPLPNDLLFISENIYKTGFRHELSISGFYSAFQARKDRARLYCGELALEREAPPETRETARNNWKYYARSASDFFDGVQFVELQHPLADDFYPCNPSVCLREGSLWCILRSVNYVLREDHYHAKDNIIRTENYLCQLNEELQPVSSVAVVEESSTQIESSPILGLEDIRLLFDGEKFLGTASVADRREDLRRQMVVFDLGNDGRVQNLSVQQHGPDQHQKNWVPFVAGGELGFIYFTDPTEILRWNKDTLQSEPWKSHSCPLALEHQRGNSGAIPFQNGWLYVTHEVSIHNGLRTYLHRFVQMDSDFRVVALTEPFYFRVLDIEFCCGLAPMPEKGKVVVSFGVRDCEAWLMVLEEEQLKERLVPVRT